MNKKFHQYDKHLVIEFSAQVAAVLSTFAHVRYNIYFQADFVEGEMTIVPASSAGFIEFRNLQCSKAVRTCRQRHTSTQKATAITLITLSDPCFQVTCSAI